MEQNIYFKQEKLFNPHKPQPKIFVYGAGSIGSHVCVGLAKVGVKDISVYDFDIVEEDNLPAQFYPISFVKDGTKVNELKKMVHFMTGVSITPNQIMITTEFEPNKEFDSIHIVAFDNIEARKIIFDGLNGFPVHLLDGRIGGFSYEKYYLNMAEDKNIETYKKTLEGKFSEQECGEKCLWVVNSLIASKIIADVIKLLNGDVPKFSHKGHLMSNISIDKE